MKSERRHELEKNELADWLADIINTIKPYQNAILAVVILAAASIGGYAWWVRQAKAEAEVGWDQFYTALSGSGLDPAEFDDIAEQYPGTYLGQWAATIAGDLHLNAGCGMLFVDKANANQELRQAVDQYTEVCDESRQPMLLERATFGLARALESQGDLEQAIQLYEDIERNWPEGAYAKEAARRAKDLARPVTKQWYDRFAKFDPKPSFADQPGTPGERLPFDFDSLPGDGSLFQPRTMMDLEEKGPDDEPTTTTPTTTDQGDAGLIGPDPVQPDPVQPDPVEPVEPTPVEPKN